MQKKLLTGILLIAIVIVFYIIFFRSTIRNTFPFSKAENVELLFYKEAQEGGTDLNKLNKVELKKKIKLSEAEKEEVFEMLYKEFSFSGSSAACYNPRHALIFTKENDTIGIIEMCLECSQIKVTEGIEQPEMNDVMVMKLDEFFKSKQ